MRENPKMVGSNIIDCVPQRGPCPNDCNQCFYNKWFYAGHEPFIPSPAEAEGKIVRVNSGHDSNRNKSLVLANTRHFKHRFYNTSIPNLDFENAPVVLTVNPRENHDWVAVDSPDNLMYVRFRANTWNMEMAAQVIEHYCIGLRVPVVMTFMRYFDRVEVRIEKDYERREHIDHEYWDIRPEVWEWVMGVIPPVSLVYTCGTPQNPYCRDCCVCEHLYYRLFIGEGRGDEILGGIANA